MTQKHKQSIRAGQLIGGIVTAMLLIILAANLYLIAARLIFKESLPKLFGYAQLAVVSGSMEPAIEVGDLLITRDFPGYDVGDIVVYDSDGTLVTHRIIEIDGDELHLKGDANNTSDPPIDRSMIVGKVIARIPQAGNFVLFLRTPAGILLLGGALALLLVLSGMPERKREAKEEMEDNT